jgi:putative DNA primase/helicase
METKIPLDPVLESNDKSKSSEYEQSDHGNAKRLLDRYGDIVRYHSSDMGEGWFIWDDKRWCKDKRQDIFQKAKSTIDHMYDELRALPESEQRNRLKFILQSKNQRGLNSMIASAQNEPGIFLEMDQFDSHKDLLNVLNGIVDLTTGKLLPHNKEKLITKLCPVDFNTEATCPRWDKFISEICPNEDTQKYLQRFFGYSITGHNRAEKMLIMNGLGENGKGVMLDLIVEILSDYTRVAESSTILKRKHERTSSNDLADLYGYRMVRASETAALQILDEARIKIITGGNTIKCRLLYKQYIEYIAQFKLVLETNHKPIIESQDNSIWRRVDRVDFTQKFSYENGKRDDLLRDTLRLELEGILQWLINGATEWYKTGLSTPKVILDLNQCYKDELDEIGGFLDQCIEPDPDSKMSKKDIFTLYKFWCNAIEEVPISKIAFGKRLEENGYQHKKSNGIEFRTGLRINAKLQESLEAITDSDESIVSNRVLRVVFSMFTKDSLYAGGGRGKLLPHLNTPCVSTDSGENHPVSSELSKKSQLSQIEVADILNIIRAEWETVKKPKHLSEYFDMFVATLKVRCKFRDYDIPEESAIKRVNEAFKAWGWSTFSIQTGK